MNIRKKITIRFILMVAIIICLGSLLVYFFSADYRHDEFYSRLQNKANSTAKMLIEVDEVDIALLKKLETNNPISLPNERIIIYNKSNEILFSTDEGSVLNINDTLLDKIRADVELQFEQDEYEVLGFLFSWRSDQFVVVAAATDTYGLNKLQNLRTILMIVFAISILIVFVSGWFFAGKALEPISQVVQQVDEIGISSLNLRVDEGNGQDELAQLAKTFNRMLERLEISFKAQKNFIANASHELRTPLTSITGQIEVSLLNARSSKEYEAVLHSVLEDIKNLNTLSNRLLVLAQTSSDGIENKVTTIRIDEMLWQTREDLIKRNPHYTIRIDFDDQLDDDSKLTIEGDEQLIRVAFANIMDNGCKYSGDHTIDVLINSTSSGLTIRFKDNGIGIAQEDLENIFEPFYRGKNTRNIKGHGIGLPLVKRIINGQKGSVQINSELGRGTVVIITFIR